MPADGGRRTAFTEQNISHQRRLSIPYRGRSFQRCLGGTKSRQITTAASAHGWNDSFKMRCTRSSHHPAGDLAVRACVYLVPLNALSLLVVQLCAACMHIPSRNRIHCSPTLRQNAVWTSKMAQAHVAGVPQAWLVCLEWHNRSKCWKRLDARATTTATETYSACVHPMHSIESAY